MSLTHNGHLVKVGFISLSHSLSTMCYQGGIGVTGASVMSSTVAYVEAATIVAVLGAQVMDTSTAGGMGSQTSLLMLIYFGSECPCGWEMRVMGTTCYYWVLWGFVISCCGQWARDMLGL